MFFRSRFFSARYWAARFWGGTVDTEPAVHTLAPPSRRLRVLRENRTAVVQDEDD